MPTQLLKDYRSAKEQLFDTLRVLDTYKDNLHKPQLLTSSEWTEIENSPGVWIKNIILHQPSTFALALVHGYEGAHDKTHRVTDNVEIHCITGRLALNGLEIKAGDRILIPANVEYSFEYLEDSYLTAKFIPVDLSLPTNFSKYGCNFPTENSITPPEIESGSYADSQRD